MSDFIDYALGLKEVQVGTQVQSIFDADQIGDVVKTTALRSLVWGTDRFDEYMREVKDGFHAQVESAFRYAQKPEYYFGLPQLSKFQMGKLESAVQPILETLYGVGTTIEYFHVGDFHPLFFGFSRLYNNYGYDESTNIITHYTAQVGYDCYLVDMVAHYSVPTDTPLTWTYGAGGVGINPKQGVTPSRPFPSDTAAPYHRPIKDSIYGVAITYEWEDIAGRIFTDTHLIDMTAYEEQAYFQAVVLKPDGSKALWSYRANTGTYSTLDYYTQFNDLDDADCFPFVVFRDDKDNLAEEPWFKDTAQHESYRELLKHLRMDYDEINTQVHGNPDIADVEQAVMTLAVPGDSEHQVDIEYLYRFFLDLHEKGFINNNYETLNTAGYLKDAGNSGHLTWTDNGFSIVLRFADLQRHIRIGMVAPLGDYKILHDTYTVEEVLRNDTYVPDVEDYVKELKNIPVIKYCYQILPGIYSEITVIGAHVKFPIGGRSTTFLTNSEQFVIPVNMNIVRQMRWFVRNEFYIRNLRFIFNAKVIQKLEWYQTGIFKIFMGMVAIAAAVVGLSHVVLTLGAITSAATFTAALSIAGNFVAQLIVFKLLGIALVDLLGPEYAFVLSVVLLATGVVGLVGTDLPGLLDPNLLIGMVSGIQDAAQSELKHLFNEYNAEYQSFLEDSASKLKELEDLEKELNLDLLDSPFKDKYTTPLSLPDETPEQFFARTIHTGNVGVMSYKTIEKFVTSSLTLPGIERDPRIEVKVYV